MLSPTEATQAAPRAADYTIADLMAEIQTLQNPCPRRATRSSPTWRTSRPRSRIKVARARLAVDNTLQMLGQELLTTSYWIDVRKIQGQQLCLPRSFGPAPTGVWSAFRQVVPWQQDPLTRPNVPPGALAYAFLTANSPAAFFPPAAGEPKSAYKAKVRRAVRSAKARTLAYAHRARIQRKFVVSQGHERPAS